MFFSLGLILLSFTSTVQAQASSVHYNPLFVDTFIRAQQDISPLEIQKQTLGAEQLVVKKEWDVQSVNPSRPLPSVYVAGLLILLALVIVKFGFNNFFQSGISGLPNDKVFLLHMRGNKFSDAAPWVIFFFIRIVVLSLIIQYAAFYATGNRTFVSLKYFGLLSGLLSMFFIAKFLAEWMVQVFVGNTKNFMIYFKQHLLITGWLWLPIIVVILVIFSNFPDFNPKMFLSISLIPLIIVGIFSLLRASMLWGAEMRVHLVYFFTYFCTFKILPYLLAIKWMSEYWVVMK